MYACQRAISVLNTSAMLNTVRMHEKRHKIIDFPSGAPLTNADLAISKLAV